MLLIIKSVLLLPTDNTIMDRQYGLHKKERLLPNIKYKGKNLASLILHHFIRNTDYVAQKKKIRTTDI